MKSTAAPPHANLEPRPARHSRSAGWRVCGGIGGGCSAAENCRPGGFYKRIRIHIAGRRLWPRPGASELNVDRAPIAAECQVQSHVDPVLAGHFRSETRPLPSQPTGCPRSDRSRSMPPRIRRTRPRSSASRAASAARSRSAPPSTRGTRHSHGDGDLASGVAPSQVTERLLDLAQRVAPVDDRRHLPRLEQRV